MRTLRIAVILFFSIVLNLQAQAQSNNSELKIGYVNPQSILANMPEMRAVQQRLQNFTARKQQELSTLEQEFQTQVAEYQQKVGVISADAQQQEEARLGQLQQDLLQAQEVAEQELAQRRDELVGPLLEQIGAAIEAVAQKQGLSYVLNTTTSSGDMIILYASEDFRAKFDITQSVMEELGMFN
ncbi:MAG: OmpH family outer membrane protein [Bacteroidetes bacterium]|jgi:outer membrane protein|nr:OmpH family outer membrane protein [Balneolaceae bacterium]MBL6916123.1 OmpH family outer membrane protein [Balneolaceae bacterium]MDA0736414.1 OmpH family outer membrane protein [Bacteroidota bacterium]MDA1126282.1 OmpH family outer membrane protein [Bacteroidota bacterium]